MIDQISRLAVLANTLRNGSRRASRTNPTMNLFPLHDLSPALRALRIRFPAREPLPKMRWSKP